MELLTQLFALLPTDFAERILKILFGAILALFGFSAMGCGPDQNAIERKVDAVMTKVVEPAVTNAAKDLKAQTGSLSGTLTGIEPGYVCDFEGFWVVGVKGKVTVRAVGVSGTVMGSVQGATSQPAVESEE